MTKQFIHNRMLSTARVWMLLSTCLFPCIAIASEPEGNFTAEITTLYTQILRDYVSLDADTILEAAKGENDEQQRIALALASAHKAAQAGNLAALRESLALVNDPRFPEDEKLRFKATALAETLIPRDGVRDIPAYAVPQEQRLAIATELLADAQCVYKHDDFATAETNLDSAGKYLLRMSRDGFPNTLQRDTKYGQVDMLKKSIEAEKKHCDELKSLYAQYRAGLGSDGEPQDATARWGAALYWVHVHGDWDKAVTYFVGCSNDAASNAAKLEAVATDATRMIACANHWLTAATDTPEGVAPCLARAAHWAFHAERASPTGKDLLDLAVIKNTLTKNGVNLQAIATRAAQTPIASSQSSSSEKKVFPKGKWVEILEYANDRQLQQNVVKGAWTISDDGLMVKPGDASRVMLPAEIGGVLDSYELIVEFERQSGEDSVNVILPLGDGRSVSLAVDGWSKQGNPSTYLADIDGRAARSQPDAVRGRLLAKQGKYSYLITVVKEEDIVSITFRLDSQHIFTWKGRVDRLSSNPAWGIPNPNRIGLRAWRSAVRFTRVAIRSLEDAPADAQANAPEAK